MSIKPRKSVMGYSDDHVLAYSALFLVCALLSALGAGALAVLGFILAVVVVEALARRGDRRATTGTCRSGR